jgi:hypothetical protein
VIVFLGGATAAQAQAVSCGFLDRKVKFIDGSSACLKEFSFLTREGVVAGEPSQSYASVASNKRSYAIAVTSDPQSCPFAQYIAWDWSGFDAKEALPKCEERLKQAMLTLAQANKSAVCICETIVDNGKSGLTRSAFAAKTQMYERQIAAGGVPMQVAESKVATASPIDSLRPAQLDEDSKVKKAADEARAALAAEETRRLESIRQAMAKEESRKLEEARVASLNQAKLEDARKREQDRITQEALQEEQLKKKNEVETLLSEARRRDDELTKLRIQIAKEQENSERIKKAASLSVTKLTARALVIGNGSYTSFQRLPNPKFDAQSIAEKLRSFGIQVDLILDADRDLLVKALNDYANKAIGMDVNILFYAGHGVQVEGINYLIPTNMRADGISAGYVKLSGIALNAVLDYMPAKTRLVFLDACRDNPASRSLIASRGAATVGLAPVSAATGTLIAYATKEGMVAADGEGLNSPYTSALLRHLDAPLDINIVLRRVRQTVLQMTSNGQEPWEYGSLIGDQLILSEMAR